MPSSSAEPRLLPVPSAALLPTSSSAYWSFYDRVATAQLTAWDLPTGSLVLELSGGSFHHAAQLAEAGHRVLQVDSQINLGEPTCAPGVQRLLAAHDELTWLRDASVDAILVESQVLSRCLATEFTVEHLVRALRPGGRLLLIVDSLLLGLARLADQGRWAELADVPAADCVLVSAEDGTLRRCFGPQALRELLVDAGLEVDWVRPRSVLSVSAVERALAAEGPTALPTLVRTELALAQEHEGESAGHYLVASARRP